jgi:hypothetical protein
VAVPTSYTESQLKAFMITALGRIATVIDWDADTDQVAEAVNDTLLAYGVDDIADATDIVKLRALSRYSVLQAAHAWLATDFRFSADGGSYDRQQVFDHVGSLLDTAHSEAFAYLPRYTVKASTVGYPADPYINDPDLEDYDDA